MKKRNSIILFVCMLLGVSLSAQTYKSFPVASENGGIQYYLPQTDIIIKFKVQKTTRTKGIYSESAYLIGVDNTALKNTTTYKILSADISTKLSADLNKQYVIVADNKVDVKKTSLGTLQSVICKSEMKNAPAKTPNKPIEKCEQTAIQPNTISSSLPTQAPYEMHLMQEGLLTRYPQMTAEKAAAEIKRLRDKQIEILSGTMEGTYLNTTVDYMYKQLDEIINSYVSLFTGIATTSEEEYVFVITPEKPIILEEDLQMPICKFSPTAGLMEMNENGEGTKIVARIHSYVSTDQSNKDNQELSMSESAKKRLNRDGAGIYYITPQMVKISIQGVDMPNCSKMIKLMQYGNINFTNTHNSDIVFDRLSGEIISQ